MCIKSHKNSTINFIGVVKEQTTPKCSDIERECVCILYSIYMVAQSMNSQIQSKSVII